MRTLTNNFVEEEPEIFVKMPEPSDYVLVELETGEGQNRGVKVLSVQSINQ